MFKSKTSAIGAIGEDLACGFLIQKGYKILKRNYWKPWGELDIIAKDCEGVLVFVEVKSVRRLPANSDLQPEDNLTSAKLIKLRRVAALFAGSNEAMIDPARGFRIDLVAVCFNPERFFHYENI
ncbi:MAG: YraN family protein [bacterium]|nr:YraN family protein [bacterium]